MKKQTYTPNPLDTSNIILDKDLLELIEKMAENIHEVWARQRILDGWKFGLYRNDKLKEHPCLIPYIELAEHEKQFDRNTVLETLKIISLFGYQINKSKKSLNA